MAGIGEKIKSVLRPKGQDTSAAEANQTYASQLQGTDPTYDKVRHPFKVASKAVLRIFAGMACTQRAVCLVLLPLHLQMRPGQPCMGSAPWPHLQVV